MKMEDYINKNIKDIITQYPEIGNILNEYNIACVSCNVGTCQLKDVVEVHNLSLEAEHELMKRMAKVIFPGKEAAIPKIKRKVGPTAGQIRYSPPVRKLVDEHAYIKKLLAAIPLIVESLNVSMAEDRQLIIDSVDFIRSYADKYHHAKEEDILFKRFGAGIEIIKAMLDEHDIGRGHVKAVLEAVESGDNNAIKKHLTAYQGLLNDHIKKEDEILYPWIDKNLTVSQVGELFNQFNEVDKRHEAVSRKYEGFANALEERFQKKEVILND